MTIWRCSSSARRVGRPASTSQLSGWGLDDVAQGVRDFAGDNRHVADYLSAEVLAALPPDRRTFMLHTAVLERFRRLPLRRGPERTDSATVLQELANSNMFLVPLDARWEWFRYHHLFAELLRLELNNEDQEAAPEIHRRAAAWCNDHDLVEDAIEHASAAGDESTVVDLLLANQFLFVRTGRAATLLRWVDILQTELLLENPGLPAVGAISAALVARPTGHRHIALAERARPAPRALDAVPRVVVNVVQAAFVEEASPRRSSSTASWRSTTPTSP